MATFRQQHFLIGLIFTEVAHVFEKPNQSLHGRAIRCIKNLMTSHETDSRYTSSEARSRIGALYIPQLNIVVNAPLHCFEQEHYLLDDYHGPTVAVINPGVFNSESTKPTKIKITEAHTKDLLLCFL